jgi:hypothetical protein
MRSISLESRCRGVSALEDERPGTVRQPVSASADWEASIVAHAPSLAARTGGRLQTVPAAVLADGGGHRAEKDKPHHRKSSASWKRVFTFYR